MHPNSVTLRKRILLLFFGVLAAMIGLVGRLFWIQFVHGQELRQMGEEVRTRFLKVEPRRGAITDRHLRELALSVTAETVVANPAEIVDPARTATELARVLDRDAEWLLTRISRRSSFEYLQRKVTPEQGRAIRDLDLPGIYLTQESQRIYPKGSLAAHVLGFTGIDSQGLNGVEIRYDRTLRGRPGRIEIEYDARNTEIPQAVHRYVEAQDGIGVQLTLDETIQYIVERELDAAMARTNAKAAWAIALEPDTGEVLAMAVRPTFEPNRWNEFEPEAWRNLAISDAFPPGSVFKPITAAAAIEEGKVTADTAFFDSGSLKLPGHTISNWNRRGLGSTDFAAAFAASSNIVLAQVGLRVGIDPFYEYLHAFQLDAPLGIDLPGEGSGIRPPKGSATQLDLALMAFGQTLTVTPLQLAAAVAAIANGGELMQPHVVKGYLDAEGNVLEPVEPKVIRRVVSERTAAEVRGLMERVVAEGTGTLAQVPGYRVAGKTGTAQKVIGGRVVPGKNIASFVGFAPADDPRVLLFVSVDEPQGIPYGGQVAAPVVGAALRDILQYLEIPADPEVYARQLESPTSQVRTAEPPPLVADRGSEQVKVPALLNLEPPVAAGLAREAGLRLRALGAGERILHQVPSAGAEVAPGTEILAFTQREALPNQQVSVPDLRGLPLREAASLLGVIGLRMQATGGGVVVEQHPGPGVVLPAGAAVQIRLDTPPIEDTPPPSPEGSAPPEGLGRNG